MPTSSFLGGFYPDAEGNIYCEQHYYEAQGMWCAGCEAPILGGRVIRMDQKVYHPDHFECAYCRKKLAGEHYVNKNEKPYCQKCNLILFG